MRKVSDVLKEIENLNKYIKILNKIIKNIESNSDVANAIREDSGVYPVDLREICSYLSVSEMTLRHQFEKCDINM